MRFPSRLRCSFMMGILYLGLGPQDVTLAQTSDMELQANLREAMAANNGPTVAGLARQILGRDPLIPSRDQFVRW